MKLADVRQRNHLRGLAVVLLTATFIQLLEKEMTAAMFELAMRKNANRHDGINHLHDYCDANQVLLNACESVFVDWDYEPGDRFTNELFDQVYETATAWCCRVWN